MTENRLNDAWPPEWLRWQEQRCPRCWKYGGPVRFHSWGDELLGWKHINACEACIRTVEQWQRRSDLRRAIRDAKDGGTVEVDRKMLVEYMRGEAISTHYSPMIHVEQTHLGK